MPTFVTPTYPQRRLREYNQCHDPNDGRFAPRGTGNCDGGRAFADAPARLDKVRRTDGGGDASHIPAPPGTMRDVGRPASSGGFEAFKQRAIDNLNRTSRTAKGVSDTSSSADKPRLNTEGDALAAKTAQNFEAALDAAWQVRGYQFKNPEDVHGFAEKIAGTVSNGLLQPGQELYRTWETKNNQTTPTQIYPGMQAWSQEFYDRLQRNADPISTAAWVEHSMAKLHPWADGVGRTTKILSAFPLIRAGMVPPQYPDKKTLYQQVTKSPEEWEAYFRSLF